MSRAMGVSTDAPPRLRAVTERRGPVIELVAATGPRELAVLLYRSAAADERAFAELFDATASRVYGLALRILRSPSQAEEVALATYLEAWRTSARFDADRCGAMAWLMTITFRLAVDRLGAAGDAPHPAQQAGLAVLGPPDEVGQIWQALARLDPEQREVLRLACGDGYDLESVHLTTILATLVSSAATPTDRLTPTRWSREASR